MKKLLSLLCCLGLLIAFALEAADCPRLLIKFPTRARDQQFFTTLDLYYSKLSNQVPYHFVISCDIDDPVMNSPQTIAKLKSYPNLSYHFGRNKSKIEACNADISKHPDFDIILLASDDMIPREQNYDLIIASCMVNLYPDYDGVLHFNDGFQGSNLITFPILGKKYYDRFGYIYHPDYKSLFCDNEMTVVAKTLNKVIYFDLMLFEHFHFEAHKAEFDDLYRKNQTYYWTDYDLYLKRAKQNFDLPIQ